MYGGAVPNPINVLTAHPRPAHDDDGAVQIAGFYDDVREVAADRAGELAVRSASTSGVPGEAGLSVSRGEKGRSLLERLWARPTCDINGIWGGYTGDGSKTVIRPCQRQALLPARARPGPGKIMAASSGSCASGCRRTAGWSSGLRQVRRDPGAHRLALAPARPREGSRTSSADRRC